MLKRIKQNLTGRRAVTKQATQNTKQATQITQSKRIASLGLSVVMALSTLPIIPSHIAYAEDNVLDNTANMGMGAVTSSGLYGLSRDTGCSCVVTIDSGVEKTIDLGLNSYYTLDYEDKLTDENCIISKDNVHIQWDNTCSLHYDLSELSETERIEEIKNQMFISSITATAGELFDIINPSVSESSILLSGFNEDVYTLGKDTVTFDIELGYESILAGATESVAGQTQTYKFTREMPPYMVDAQTRLDDNGKRVLNVRVEHPSLNQAKLSSDNAEINSLIAGTVDLPYEKNFILSDSEYPTIGVFTEDVKEEGWFNKTHTHTIKGKVSDSFTKVADNIRVVATDPLTGLESDSIVFENNDEPKVTVEMYINGSLKNTQEVLNGEEVTLEYVREDYNNVHSILFILTDSAGNKVTHVYLPSSNKCTCQVETEDGPIEIDVNIGYNDEADIKISDTYGGVNYPLTESNIKYTRKGSCPVHTREPNESEVISSLKLTDLVVDSTDPTEITASVNGDVVSISGLTGGITNGTVKLNATVGSGYLENPVSLPVQLNIAKETAGTPEIVRADVVGNDLVVEVNPKGNSQVELYIAGTKLDLATPSTNIEFTSNESQIVRIQDFDRLEPEILSATATRNRDKTVTLEFEISDKENIQEIKVKGLDSWGESSIEKDLTKRIGTDGKVNSYIEYTIADADGNKLSADFIETSASNIATTVTINGVATNNNLFIRAKDLSGNASAEQYVDIIELPCECGITVTSTRRIEANIGTSTGGEVTLNPYFVDISSDTSPIRAVKRQHYHMCPVHDTDNAVAETTGYKIINAEEIVSLSVGSGAIGEDNGEYLLGLDGITTDTAEVTIKGKLQGPDGRLYAVQYTLIIIRSEQAPIIKSWNYDGQRQEATITVDPIGNASTEIFVAGVSIGTKNFDSQKGGMGGNWGGGFGGNWGGPGGGWGGFTKYVTTDFKISLPDTVPPLPVSNISIARETADPTRAIISWDPATDKDNFVKVHVKTNGKTSNDVQVNVKSATVRKEVILYDADGNLVQYYETAGDEISVPVLNLYWGGYVAIQCFDEANNPSSILTYYIPNEVVYTTTTVPDSIVIEEGGLDYIDAKGNDIHDPAYATPVLESVVIIAPGLGKTYLVDASQLTDIRDVEGLMVAIEAQDGELAPIQVRYTYAQVRSDIPAASGIISVTIKQRNKEPIANADGADLTQYLGAESNTVFYVPYSLMLANDYDREIDERTPGYENAKLSVYALREAKGCTAVMDNANQRVKVTPSEGYYGYVSFEYRITDGEALSVYYAKVTVYVANAVVAPTAKRVDTVMEMSAIEHSIALNVDNPSAVPYTLDDGMVIKYNGVAVDEDIMQAVPATIYDNELGMIRPYVKILVNNPNNPLNLQIDDLLTIDYTVRNQKGASKATIYITVTIGDDPYDMEGYLYVHRRPLAIFSLTVHKDASGTMVRGITLPDEDEQSYDIDHQIQHAIWRADKPYTLNGLRTWEWGVKTIDGDWTTEQFDADDYANGAVGARDAGITWINDNANLMIQQNPGIAVVVALRVRDVDGPDNVGEWSEQRSMLLVSIPMKPVAQFTTDKSTYIVPTAEAFNMVLTDLSYDSNGDDIIKWQWEIESPDGEKKPYVFEESTGGLDIAAFNNTVSAYIRGKVRSSSYNPDDPTFKISLIVTDNGKPSSLDSDKYSVSFKVYKDNDEPVVESGTSSQLGSIASSTLYEIDDGADGVVGDDWGTANNTVHKGKIDFPSILKITDDQDTRLLKVDWMFDGQKVDRRAKFIDGKDSDVVKMYRGLKYNQFQSPFTHTVTDEGFKPGAYKLTVSVTDAPSGNAYMPGAAKTTYWHTYAKKAPYHIYVVPKLDLFMHNEVNGWIDQEYRLVGDTKVGYEDDGLEIEDIVPTIGDTIRFFGTTNQYVTKMSIYNDLNDNGIQESGEGLIILDNIKQNLDLTKEWEGYFELEDVEDAEEGQDLTILNFKIIAETNWGSDNETTTRIKIKPMPIKALPVKLYDFRVTSVTDPNVYESFRGYLDKLISLRCTLPSGGLLDGVPVYQLAVDRTSTEKNANTNGALVDKANAVSKGYSFYYKISSKGMAKDEDEIRIVPRFYAIEVDESGKTTSIGQELHGYLPDSKGVYRIYTSEITNLPQAEKEEFEKTYELFYEGALIHSLNKHYDMRIGTELRVMDGNSQTWSGRYGIPADAKFFRGDVSRNIANEYKGDILITFDITAYKNNKARYNYVERGQWAKEREVSIIPNTLKEVYKSREASWKSSDILNGAIITFDGRKTLTDNYISNPVWRE